MEQYGTDVMEERYGLAMERIGQIEKEQTVPAPYGEYFRKTAGFLLLMGQVRELLRSGGGDELTLEQWQEWNRRIYEDILPENYGESYGNPVLAERKLFVNFFKKNLYHKFWQNPCCQDAGCTAQSEDIQKLRGGGPLPAALIADGDVQPVENSVQFFFVLCARDKQEYARSGKIHILWHIHSKSSSIFTTVSSARSAAGCGTAFDLWT